MTSQAEGGGQPIRLERREQKERGFAKKRDTSKKNMTEINALIAKQDAGTSFAAMSMMRGSRNTRIDSQRVFREEHLSLFDVYVISRIIGLIIGFVIRNIAPSFALNRHNVVQQPTRMEGEVVQGL